MIDHTTSTIWSTLLLSGSLLAQGTPPDQDRTPRPSAQIPAAALYNLEDALLDWPLSVQNKAYAAIDGKRLHEYVSDLAAISRRYRDQGHPQFWGRIIGTPADSETATL